MGIMYTCPSTTREFTGAEPERLQQPRLIRGPIENRIRAWLELQSLEPAGDRLKDREYNGICYNK